MVKDLDVKNDKKVKKLLKYVKDKIEIDTELKSIILLKDKDSMNFKVYENYKSDTVLSELDDLKSSYALVYPFCTWDGVKVFMVDSDTHANIKMKWNKNHIFTIDDKSYCSFCYNEIKIDNRKKNNGVICEYCKTPLSNPYFENIFLTASEIYAIHNSTHTKRVFPFPKVDMNLALTLLAFTLLSVITTWFICFAVYNG